MKKIWIVFPIIIIFILALAALLIFVWGNVQYNSAYFNQLRSLDCNGDFDCIHEHFLDCDPVNGGFVFGVVGENSGRCLVFARPGGFLIRSADTTQYYCCFPFEYLDNFDVEEPEKEMKALMANFDTNPYCKELRKTDVLLKKIDSLCASK